MWTIGTGIMTPNGFYMPKTDDLRKELVEAAKFAGLNAFNVKIDGNYVETPEALHTNSLAALAAPASIESVEVEAHDTAGC